jgi:signal peptidase I
LKRHPKLLIVLLAVAVALFLFGRYVASPFLVVGDSMTPTLHSWDLCLVRRARHYQPHRGDIVVFRTADDPPLHFVKRVVALPGESVAIQRGVVMINQTPLAEPYTTANAGWDMPAVKVAPLHVFVLGDNREVSLDLTLHGPVATRLIKARLVWHWRWKK